MTNLCNGIGRTVGCILMHMVPLITKAEDGAAGYDTISGDGYDDRLCAEASGG